MAGAAGKGCLELPGEVLSNRVAHPETDVSREIGCRVEDLVGAYPSNRGSDHVADRVAAGFPRAQTHFAQQPQHLRAPGQRHVMELEVLPGGDVAFAQRGVLLSYGPQGFQRLRREDATRDLYPHHLHVGLPLPVHALPEPEGNELAVLQFSGDIRGRLLFEALYLVVDEWNDPRGGLGQLLAFPVEFLLGAYLNGLGPSAQLILLRIRQNKNPPIVKNWRAKSGLRGC